MSLELYPCICGELVESLSEHVRKDHVGCDLWRCGVCDWEDADLDAVFSHCFKLHHDPAHITSRSLARMIHIVAQIWRSSNSKQAPTPPTELALETASCPTSQLGPEQRVVGRPVSTLPPEGSSSTDQQIEIKPDPERNSESPEFAHFTAYRQKLPQKRMSELHSNLHFQQQHIGDVSSTGSLLSNAPFEQRKHKIHRRMEIERVPSPPDGSQELTHSTAAKRTPTLYADQEGIEGSCSSPSPLLTKTKQQDHPSSSESKSDYAPRKKKVKLSTKAKRLAPKKSKSTPKGQRQASRAKVKEDPALRKLYQCLHVQSFPLPSVLVQAREKDSALPEVQAFTALLQARVEQLTPPETGTPIQWAGCWFSGEMDPLAEKGAVSQDKPLNTKRYFAAANIRHDSASDMLHVDKIVQLSSNLLTHPNIVALLNSEAPRSVSVFWKVLSRVYPKHCMAFSREENGPKYRTTLGVDLDDQSDFKKFHKELFALTPQLRQLINFFLVELNMFDGFRNSQNVVDYAAIFKVFRLMMINCQNMRSKWWSRDKSIDRGGSLVPSASDTTSSMKKVRRNVAEKSISTSLTGAKRTKKNISSRDNNMSE